MKGFILRKPFFSDVRCWTQGASESRIRNFRNMFNGSLCRSWSERWCLSNDWSRSIFESYIKSRVWSQNI